MPDNALHNVASTDDTDEGNSSPEEPNTAANATGAPSAQLSSVSLSATVDGTWGERDVGGPVQHRAAMEDFEEMRRELSAGPRRPSTSSAPAGRQRLRRWSTSKSKRSDRDAQKVLSYASDPEVGDVEAAAVREEDFELGPFIKEGYFEKRNAEGQSAKKVGVVFKNLTVQGSGGTTGYIRTFPSALVGTFGPDLYRLLCRLIPACNFGPKSPTRTLLNDFTGVVRNGEMMLVLGRPGSGCSTFLKTIANQRGSYAKVDGDVSYGGISAEKQKAQYRGEVGYNPEDDQHLPTLNVMQTLRFSLLNKTKKRAKGEMNIIIEALMKMFGIGHTRHTLVGNEFVRGISGGERKRVSIAETLATKSTVVCWDNSTRGLDASTALDYANSLRIMTDVSNRTTFVTLYQAGEGIYELMDKVLVIDQGRMIYQGPAKEAKQYFTNMGLVCPERETTADFLTSVTDPKQRIVRKGFESSVPRSTTDFEAAFRCSDHYRKLLADVDDYEKHLGNTGFGDAKEFEQSVQEQKSRRVSNESSYTISFARQVSACTRREFWLVFGDKPTLYTKFFIIVSNALIVGSLFFRQSTTTTGAFSRGGTLFFSLLFLGWLQLTELMRAVSGRAVIQRHRQYAFYRPSAVSIARVIADFPLLLVQVIIFCTILYFMSDLDADASKFFIYLLFVYAATINITALYRMFASLSPTIDDAVRFSGTGLNLLIIYTGYAIPKPQLLHQKIWFGWLYYINPVSYAFEGVLTNEFHHRIMPCGSPQLIPQGSGVQPPYQGCAISGARAGDSSVTGERYLEVTFSYHRSNLWRNFGVIVAFTVLYILITAVASEVFSLVGGGGGALLFKKSAKAKKHITRRPPVPDIEKGKASGQASLSSTKTQLEGDERDTSASGSGSRDTSTSASSKQKHKTLPETSTSESVFTWTSVNYSVPYQDSQKSLLHNVNGYAKPGSMVALMGVSGAGKTTLLNTLSQRQRLGTVEGEMLVDGKPLGPEFQRMTGFVEQMDLHDMTATIREAIEFSAILRQERHISRAEKLKYVDEIIEVLELREIEDAVISSLGVEQRKRVTIGVELAAKPALLFLDEPTSGLDSQSAYSIVRFLQRLAAAGHGIICTIHQPSSILIQQFDMILALNPGGQTFYFGPVGDNGIAVASYFAKRGVHCPPQKNIAEFILETAIKGEKRADGRRPDWQVEWQRSDENKALLAEISKLNADRAPLPRPPTNDQHEFASPLYLQCTTLTKRMFIQHWRDPSYLYGKVFVAVVIGIANGFTFYKLGNTIVDMQNRMFTSFLIILIPPTVVNAVVPKFYQNLSLWMFREHPSRIYGWVAFCTASVVTEVPWAFLTSVIYWTLWYWPVGLPSDASTAGYVFFMVMLFFLFQASWGQWICAFAPSFTVISNVLPFFFVMFGLFNGVIQPYSSMNVFYRYWIYYLLPSTYWIGGVISAVLRDLPVQCAPSEAAYFNPLPGQTCAQYAGRFVTQAGRGYLTNPNATTECGYCPYRDGVEYMATLNVSPNDKWRDLGIFAGFVASNYLLVYFFIYTVRVKGWKFGMGFIFGGLGKMVDLVEGLVVRKNKRKGGEA